ncbi:MAG: CHAT domain-containing protein [Myxococcales bacterium]|nr:CHAT domain-containing protein [Myxococcales bacterium]
MTTHRKRRPWSAALGATMLLWLALADHQAVEPECHTTAAALGVLWTGCRELRLSPRGEPEVCLIEPDRPRPFQAWVPSSISDPRVTVDGQVLPLGDPTEVDDGWSFSVELDHARHVELSGRLDGHSMVLLALDVELRPPLDPSFKPRLDDALDDQGARDALEQEVRRHRLEASSPEARLLYTEQLGQVLFDQGRLEDSAALALEAARMARDQGEPLRECARAWSASYLYGEALGRYAEARRVFEELCDYEASVPDVTMLNGYYVGLLQLHLGQLAQARRSIERALEIARRLRWSAWERTTINPLARVLASQGRFRWADQLLSRAEELVPAPDSINLLRRCEPLTNTLRQRGELALREARLLGRPFLLAREHLERARALYLDRTVCPEHPVVADSLAAVDITLARLDLYDGRPLDAKRRVDAIHPDRLTMESKVPWRLLQIELALERGATEQARGSLQALEAELHGALADAAEPEQRWRWFLLEARLHQAQGDLTGAIASLARAQAVLERAAEATRSTVEADRRGAMQREGSQLLVRLLLEAGQLEPALCAARISRIRGLVGMESGPTTRASVAEARRLRRARLHDYRWYDPHDVPTDVLMEIETGLDDLMTALPMSPRAVRCKDLPPPRPGEMSLLPFHDGKRWLGFAWADHGPPVVEPLSPSVAEGDPSARGEALLAPFAAMLAEATRLRVLLPSSFHDVSVPDLGWAGAPLGNAKAVVHGLDLPIVPRTASQRAAALVFSDPQWSLGQDLPELRDHFRRWAEHLERHGLPVVFDREPDEAASPPSASEVLQGTEGVQLALLYGFGGDEPGYYDLLADHEGAEPDQRSFVLAAAGLVRSDILLHQGRGPRHVILALCGSAEVDPYGVSGAVGLAQSYVQAGAEWAVGTAGPVDPRTMVLLTDVLIDAYASDPSADAMAKALQDAKRRIAAQQLPHGEQLRLWVP